MDMIKTKEPLRIEAECSDDNFYVLPQGTVLYHVESMAEGHQLYLAYFYHKGAVKHEKVIMEPKFQGNLIAPLWLANIDADTLKTLFKRFPLSKDDVAAAINANEITRDDLADIIRSLPK